MACLINFGDTKAQEIEELTLVAARIKATKRMAYADCFAVTLARLKEAELSTGDPEFKTVEKEVKVVWL